MEAKRSLRRGVVVDKFETFDRQKMRGKRAGGAVARGKGLTAGAR